MSCCCAVCTAPDFQVPAYLKRNQQIIAQEQQQLEEYIKLKEQPVRREKQPGSVTGATAC